mmetsp:Transcript_11670/g.35597  ORF Transcript_11670/g.35597 Transcript_11670/m.35597 type:complete len:365 (-) Transcript_11670:1515-2609(-)
MEILNECSAQQIVWLLGKAAPFASRDGEALTIDNVFGKNKAGDPSLMSSSQKTKYILGRDGPTEALGQSIGITAPVPLQAGDIVEERFVLRKDDQPLPSGYSCVTFANGSRAISKMRKTDYNLITSLYIFLDENQTEVLRTLVAIKLDCEVCSMCNMQCNCTKEMYMTGSGTGTANEVASGNTTWETFCSFWTSKTERNATMTVVAFGQWLTTPHRETLKHFVRVGHEMAASRYQPASKSPETAFSLMSTEWQEAPKKRQTARASDNATCSICNSVFTRRADLVRHIHGVHEAVRKYECTKCSRRFTQNAHLKGHYKSIHDKVRDWQCTVCDRRFSTKFQMERHANSIHGIDLKASKIATKHRV